RSSSRGKLFKKHVEVANAGIDRGSFFISVLVNGCITRNKGIHIRNSNEHLDIAIRQALGHLDLVKVLGSVVVNGRPKEIAQIANLSARRYLWRMGPQLC